MSSTQDACPTPRRSRSTRSDVGDRAPELTRHTRAKTPRRRVDSRSIRRTVSIAAPRERVWRALTRPSEIGLWWPVLAQFQPKTGKPYRFEWGCSLVAAGQVLAARAPSRLALSWTIPELEAGVAPTKVTFELGREGRTTRLSLEHSGFAPPRGDDDEYFLSHVEGWDVDLEELASLCETGAVGRVLVARGALASDRVQAFERVVARLEGRVTARAEDEEVLALEAGCRTSRARLRVDLTSGRPELVVTETFSTAEKIDEKAAYGRWRRVLKGCVRELVCGTVYS